MALSTMQVIPILRIFDVAKAKEFYIDYLGFKVDWEHRYGENFPLYMQVSLGSLVLHLTEHHGDCSPGATVYVKVSGLGDFHRELAAKNYRFLKPGLAKDGDCLELELADPFGNRFRINQESGQK
jgi:catechol 2,3-dioxygenase-like lactoylglutathione lyase family enzyme